MRKLKLNVDSLKVQTFEIDLPDDLKGTVRANETVETTGGPWLCPAYCDSGVRTCNADCELVTQATCVLPGVTC